MGPRQDGRRCRSNEGPEQRVVCPCHNCGGPENDRPTPRLMSIVEKRIKKYDISPRWKVSMLLNL